MQFMEVIVKLLLIEHGRSSNHFVHLKYVFKILIIVCRFIGSELLGPCFVLFCFLKGSVFRVDVPALLLWFVSSLVKHLVYTPGLTGSCCRYYSL